MIRSLLLGLDGSPHSTVTTELAISWAQRSSATLIGLGIVDEEAIEHREAVPLGGGAYKKHRDETLLSDAHRRLDAAMGQFTARCAEAGVRCRAAQERGEPSQHILREAQRADVILLGTRTFFSSDSPERPDDTLQNVLKLAFRPVVAVPAHWDGPGPVVVAYDGSLQAARTLQLFQLLQPYVGQDVHLLAVHSDRLQVNRWLAAAEEFLSVHEISVQAHPLVTQENASKVILEESQKLKAGLLVMGAYGQPKLREFLLGSVTYSVLRDTRIPLFLYH